MTVFSSKILKWFLTRLLIRTLNYIKPVLIVIPLQRYNSINELCKHLNQKNTLIFKTRIRKTINTLSATVGVCSAKVDMEQDYLNAYQKVLQWLVAMETFFDNLVDICDTKIQEIENSSKWYKLNLKR